MQLKCLDLRFLLKPDVKYYGKDFFGNNIYLYHDIAFVDLHGRLIPYLYINEE